MNIKNLILYRLERAKETIIEAENMANISHWNSCVNKLINLLSFGNLTSFWVESNFSFEELKNIEKGTCNENW